MWAGEKIVDGCKYTTAKSPKWIKSWPSGKQTYDPLAYFIHCIPNAERIHGGVRESKSEPASTPLDDASC